LLPTKHLDRLVENIADDTAHTFCFVILVVTFVHEMAHVLRSLHSGSQSSTPREFGRPNEFGDSETMGEGGWWLERRIFGGKIGLITEREAYKYPTSETPVLQGISIQSNISLDWHKVPEDILGMIKNQPAEAPLPIEELREHEISKSRVLQRIAKVVDVVRYEHA